MSRSKYKVYNGKTLKKLFENSRIFFITLLFIIGIIAGAISVSEDTVINDKISVLADSFLSIRAEQGMAVNFFNSLAVNGIFAAVSLFLGFSLIGYPFIICLPLFKGLGLGAFCGYIYSTYKIIGLGYSISMIYPGAIVSAFALILSCNNSCEYSKNAYLKALKRSGEYEKDETRVYLTRQLVFYGICAISSAIDALFCQVFSRFFEI